MAHHKDKSSQLLEKLSFYGAYHSNGWNQVIHVLFVPLIWWATVILACYTGPLISFDFATFVSKNQLPIPTWISENLELNLGTLAGLFYIVYYLCLGDIFVAATYNVILFGLLLHANSFYREHGADAWKYALVGKIIGWVLQVSIGHNVFEGRKPALLDSLFDAIVMAPLFTWYETLFFLGYRKEFKAKLDARIQEKIKQLDAGTSKRRS